MEVNDPLSDRALRYRRNVISLAVLLIVIGWLPNVSLSQIDFVSALDDDNTGRTLIVWCIAALIFVWSYGWYLYLMKRDFVAWTDRVTDRNSWPELSWYRKEEPSGKYRHIQLQPEKPELQTWNWIENPNNGMVGWSGSNPKPSIQGTSEKAILQTYHKPKSEVSAVNYRLKELILVDFIFTQIVSVLALITIAKNIIDLIVAIQTGSHP